MNTPSGTSKSLRVMVADDSPIARRLIELVLGRSDCAELVAEQSNGCEVLSGLREHAVDVLILDLDMPEVDGLSVLTELGKLKRPVGVIIYSGASQDMVDDVSRCLGGHTPWRFMAKGEGVGGGVDGLNEWLVPTVRELGDEVRRQRAGSPAGSTAGSRALAQSGAPSDAAESHRPKARASETRIGLLVLGASTGGPDALMQMLEELPADIGVPMALVQHMPAGFTAQLAARLDAKCAISVREAVDGERMESGCLLVAPGGKHLEIHRAGPHLQARLTERPPENSCRPAVDVLFRTAAKALPRNLLGVVLTGMGQDGMLGAEEIRSTGGTMIVQDEESSVVWGMPGAIAKAGHADLVLPLKDVAGEVTARVKRASSQTKKRSA